jgi:hypothetical protein
MRWDGKANIKGLVIYAANDKSRLSNIDAEQLIVPPVFGQPL